MDALSHKETADHIEIIKIKAGKEQTPYEYKDLKDLGAEIRVAVMKKAAPEFHNNVTDPTPPTFKGSPPWSGQSVPVTVGCVPGTDNLQLEKIQQAGGTRFKAFALSPDDTNYLDVLDKGIRTAQFGVLLLTPSSLSRYSTGMAAEKFRAALDLLKLRTGNAVILCEGLSKDQLPPEWPDALILEYRTGAFVNQTEITLEQLYNKLRERIPSLTTEPRLALPYMIIAPTQSEAKSLLDPNSQLFEQFNEDEPVVRRKELKQIAQIMRQNNPNWPANLYGTTQSRRDWKCFSPKPTTAEELISNVIDRINNAQPGSRERLSSKIPAFCLDLMNLMNTLIITSARG